MGILGVAIKGFGKALQKAGQKVQKAGRLGGKKKTPGDYYHAMTTEQKRARRARARLKDQKKLTPKYNKDGSLRKPRISKQMKEEQKAGKLEKIESEAKKGRKGSFQKRGRKPLRKGGLIS